MYRCPRCHVELPADARFCKNCGFNQTNARIASMRPPLQGVQRQAPPQTQQGGQQTPTRTIQPQHKYVSQQPAGYQATFQPQNVQVPQQNFPGTPFVSPPQSPVRTAMPNNAQQVAPLPQQGNVPQRNNGFQHPPQQYRQDVQIATTPLQEPSRRLPQPPATPQGQVVRQPNDHWVPEQVVRISTPPMQQYAPAHTSFEPLQWGLGALPDTPVSVESLQATSKAAQHWRQSWLDRQHAEAGPAVNVSRGQASVPEPLLAMQNSLARMRAIILPKNGVDGKESRLRFWLPVILLICLIGGIGAYILSTYGGGIVGASSASVSANAVPTLTIKNAKTTTVAAGQAVHVHGEHFGPNDTIVFYLDAIQLTSAGGKPATAQSDDKGAFDTSLSIPTTQVAGEYAMQARDTASGQHAFLDIQTTAKTTTNVVQLSVPTLTFSSMVGHDPRSQSVSITNTSNTTISWSASATSDDGAGWLLVANDTASGQLEAGQTAKIRVIVSTKGLPSNPTGRPYTGEINFTILHQGLAVLPVKLILSETSTQLIVTPNPLIAIQSTPGGCQPETSLTLINLSSAPVNWSVQTNGASQQVITLDGKAQENGQLAALGFPKDTQVIQIGCNGVQLNKQYDINVFYNGSQQQVPISVVNG